MKKQPLNFSCRLDLELLFITDDQLGPFEVKSLLNFVLSARDQTIGVINYLSAVVADRSATSPTHTKAVNLDISVQAAGHSDGNFCHIKVNGQVVVAGGERGMNVVVLNPEDGSIMESTSFDTHMSREESEDFAWLIESVESGTIVVVASRDDVFEHLTEAAKQACESIGSKSIREVEYRDSWCIIGIKAENQSLTLLPQVEEISKRKSGPTKAITKTFAFGTLNVLEEIEDTDPMALLASDKAYHIAVQFLPNKGHWLRRRKIDGALQRTPNRFYPKIHKILECSATGIVVNGNLLPRDPTIFEKTPEEMNFALQVEVLLNALSDPAERQIAVECLMVISEIEKRNPEVKLGGGTNVLDLMKIVNEAYMIFWKEWIVRDGRKLLKKSKTEVKTDDDTEVEVTDEGLLQKYPYDKYASTAKRIFFDLLQDGRSGTMAYLAKASLSVLPYEIHFGEMETFSAEDSRNNQPGQVPADVSSTPECRQS